MAVLRHPAGCYMGVGVQIAVYRHPGECVT